MCRGKGVICPAFTLKMTQKLDKVPYTCNLGYHPGQKVSKILSQKRRQVWWHTPMQEAKAEGLWYEAGQGQKLKALSEKGLKEKRARGVVQVVQHLPSKHKAQNSHPNAAYQHKKKRKRFRKNYLSTYLA
jgi:hypothetical protein